MPSLEDEAFARSVVYLCEHSEKGALGLIINKPLGIDMQSLFGKVDLTLRRQDLCEQPVLHGGPLQTERGFVLHDPMRAEGGQALVHELLDAQLDPAGSSGYAATLSIPGGVDMTTSRDVLEALSLGVGPSRVLVTLGYSSWGEGQLEEEISGNAWLIVKADLGVIFDTPVDQRYDRALALLGVQSWMISSDVGHA